MGTLVVGNALGFGTSHNCGIRFARKVSKFRVPTNNVKKSSRTFPGLLRIVPGHLIGYRVGMSVDDGLVIITCVRE